jgi:hypothetical protein
MRLGLQEYGTTGLWDYRNTGLQGIWGYRTMGQDYKRVSQDYRDYMGHIKTIGIQDYRTIAPTDQQR